MNKKLLIIIIAVFLVAAAVVSYFLIRNSQKSSQDYSSDPTSQIIAVLEENKGKDIPPQTISGQVKKDGRNVDGTIIFGSNKANVSSGKFEMRNLTSDAYFVQFVDDKGYAYNVEPGVIQVWGAGVFNFTVKY